MTKKFVVWTALITVAVLFLIFFSFSWTMTRQDLVLAGLAKPFFPYFKYSQDELNKLYPQYINIDVATTQFPEETHKLFVSKLKAGDLNGAVECCFVKGKWGEMRDGLENVKKQGQMDLMINDLDSGIKAETIGDTKSLYFYSIMRDSKKYKEYLSFIKNSQGVWLIESL